MRTPLLLLLAGACAALPGRSWSEDFPQYTLHADPAAVADGIPSDLRLGRFTLWLPEGHAGRRIRGIISVVDYQDGASLWRDSKNTHMRATLNRIMAENDMGMMLEYVINHQSESKLYKNTANDWCARASFHALNHYASVTGHPELRYAPLLWTGLSQSGGTAYLKSRKAPARTIGAIPYHASVASADYSGIHGIPILAPLGDRDTLSTRSVPIFQTNVAAGAHWLPYVQDNTEHHRLDGADEHQMEYDWIRWVINARVPRTISGTGPVALIPLETARGWYVKAGFTGQGTSDSRFRYDNVVVSPAAAGRPSGVVGWIPDDALMQLWVDRARLATVGTVTVVGTPPPAPTVTITASDAAAGEPADHGAVRIARSAAASTPLTVTFTLGGTATIGGDCVAPPTTATIPAGATTVTVPITVLDDAIVEPAETVTVTLAAGSGYVVGAASAATVTIADDDVAAPSARVHWAFAEGAGTTAADHGAAGWPATLRNGAGWTAGVDGAALLLGNPTLTELRHAASALQPIGNGTAITVALWLRNDGGNAYDAGLASHLSRNGGVCNGGWELALAKGKLTFTKGDPATGVFNSTVASPVLAALADGGWHHVAATWSAADGRTRLWLDGVQVATGLQPSASLGAATAELRAGLTAINAREFHGAIDELQVHDTALDAAAIDALATMPAPVAGG